jgi:hypothetical protein
VFIGWKNGHLREPLSLKSAQIQASTLNSGLNLISHNQVITAKLEASNMWNEDSLGVGEGEEDSSIDRYRRSLVRSRLGDSQKFTPL